MLARCCASSPRGGRIAVSDLVAEDHLTPAKHAERGSDVGCIAAALLKSEYLDGSAAAGFTDAELEFTHEAAPGNHSAIVRATEQQSRDCAETEQQASNVSKGSYGRFWPRFSVRHERTAQDRTARPFWHGSGARILRRLRGSVLRTGDRPGARPEHPPRVDDDHLPAAEVDGPRCSQDPQVPHVDVVREHETVEAGIDLDSGEQQLLATQVSKRTAYQHFSTKDDLVAEYLRRFDPDVMPGVFDRTDLTARERLLAAFEMPRPCRCARTSQQPWSCTTPSTRHPDRHATTRPPSRRDWPPPPARPAPYPGPRPRVLPHRGHHRRHR